MRLNVMIAVLAAVVLAVFAVLYFVIAGGSNDGLENGLSVEEQSPRIEQKSDEATQQTAADASAPAGEKETPAFEESTASEESDAPSSDSESAGAAQPDAPQAALQDPFTVELQDALTEFKELTQRFVELHPGPRATDIAALMNEVADSVAEYNEELQDQNLERGERAARLAARLSETAQRLQPEVDAVTDAMDPGEEEAYDQFFENNKPRKLFALLGLPLQ